MVYGKSLRILLSVFVDIYTQAIIYRQLLYERLVLNWGISQDSIQAPGYILPHWPPLHFYVSFRLLKINEAMAPSILGAIL